jgi:hypothetical protein
VLNRPDHRLNTDADRWIVELNLQAIRTVVDDYLAGAVRAKQKLNRVPVGMLTAYRAFRDSVDDEE